MRRSVLDLNCNTADGRSQSFTVSSRTFHKKHMVVERSQNDEDDDDNIFGGRKIIKFSRRDKVVLSLRALVACAIKLAQICYVSNASSWANGLTLDATYSH
ncbi:hypothetical protein EVAR_93438_1 [Eumeta japonica]|uniref:Uncharacterized protein n=1 Tax=Eumeta variegata TaxID=151549 RepID=A0A4C1TJ41_EUMVA|nr:hypothetical protein EVAR_93438_1 [Eumeta japonica]